MVYCSVLPPLVTQGHRARRLGSCGPVPATEQDSEVQCAQGAEGERWKETVSEILNSSRLFLVIILYSVSLCIKLYDSC